MTVEDRIRAALAVRKDDMAKCPFQHPDFARRPKSGEPCPRCKATTAGPCWIGVGADAAFVDAIKEIVS